MDIAGLSMAMHADRLAQAVSLSVLKMSMDAQKQDAEMLRKMLERTLTPHLGGNIDISI